MRRRAMNPRSTFPGENCAEIGRMSWLKTLGLVRGDDAETKAEPEPFLERRGETRRPVFQEAVLVLEDYYRLRAVVTDLSSRGARVQYFTKVDLPFRIRMHAPVLKLNCWARVVWQREGSAGLEFAPIEAAPLD
jgi:PilZ domain